MKHVQDIERARFLELVYRHRDEFMASIDAGRCYVVKRFYPRELIMEMRALMGRWRRESAPSWHPCYDGVPDYHRINDLYPHSYVKARMRSFYFHRFNARRNLFERFKDIFELKNFLAGEPRDAYYDTVPSDNVISRLTCHQYPRGGGWLEEHVDPVSNFAKIQTLVQAADFGQDFESGGLYYRLTPQGEPIMIDPLSELGDLIVLSPGVRHGVMAVDAERRLDWETDDGRWTFIPIIIYSDYVKDPATKPRGVQAS
jgi:hypothetical protein